MQNKFLLIIIFCFIFFPLISGNITNANKPLENYTTIQEAINNASKGDVILVSAGVYNENIIINKSIALLGAQNGINGNARDSWNNESIISSSYSEGTIQVQEDDVLINGFKINNTFKGIHVTEDSSNLTIINNIILGPMNDGINLWRAKSAYVENNFVKDAAVSGITGGDDRGTSNTNDDLITKAIIKNNIVENSRYGITGYQKNSVIENNLVKDYSGEGAGIGGQFINVNIKNNTIRGYSSGAGFALSPYENRSNSSGITFEKNTVTENAAGIYATQNVFGKLININHNYIYNNLQYDAVNLNAETYETLNAEYNYWGDCTGPDEGKILGNENVDYEPWLGICLDETTENQCPIEGENLSLYANVSSENCIEEMIFSVKLNNSWKNFSGVYDYNKIGDYVLHINSDLIKHGNLEWKAYAKDCYGNTYTNGIETSYIYSKTKLTIVPPEPNGENGWYIVNPIFILENENPNIIYYKWDSQSVLVYPSLPFGFEDAPNNQNITGGTIDLNYWSELDSSCNKNESAQKIILKSDLTNPSISSLNPKEGATINQLKPKISADLNEIYQSNSGINTSSIVLELDGKIVTPNITIKGINALVEYIPEEDLSEEMHNLSVYVKDNAGRESEKSWNFYVKFVNISFDLNVNSPDSEIYGTSKVIFNITTTKKVKLIEYTELNSRNIWTRLCSNCNNYGNSTIRTKVFREGMHNLTIRATNSEGFAREKNISFFIDSKAPKIYLSSPKSGRFTDGSDFYVKFIEDNLKDVTLTINKTLSYGITDCSKTGKYTECYADIDLSMFEGKEIEYFFSVSDSIRSVNSKPVKIKVDSLKPTLNIISPENNGNYSKKILFEVQVNESNFKSLKYAYESNGAERIVSLCTRLLNNTCKITKSFIPGNYSITIIAEDKSGHMAGTNVEFKVK